jgi:hypothetical protein
MTYLITTPTRAYFGVYANQFVAIKDAIARGETNVLVTYVPPAD